MRGLAGHRCPNDCLFSTADTADTVHMALRQTAKALGVINGSADTEANTAVTAYTASSGNSHEIQLETKNSVALPNSEGRFLTFSVNAVAANCAVTDGQPLLHSYLRTEAGDLVPLSKDAINTCTDPRSAVYTVDGREFRGGSFASNGSLLLQVPTVDIVRSSAPAIWRRG